MDPTRSASHLSYPPNFRPAQHIQGDIAANFCPSGSVQRQGRFLPPPQMAPYMDPRSIQPVAPTVYPPPMQHAPASLLHNAGLLQQSVSVAGNYGHVWYSNGMQYPTANGYICSSGYSPMESIPPPVMHQQLQNQRINPGTSGSYAGNNINISNNNSGVVVNNYNPDQHVAAETKKRKRTSFTAEQMLKMEEQYQLTPYLTRTARIQLALTLDLDEKQILFWFQNRRMRKKKTANQAASVNQAAKETSKDEEEEEDKTQGRCSKSESSLDVQQQATEGREEADKIEGQSLVNKDQTTNDNRPTINIANELGEPDVQQSTISHEDASTAPSSQPPGNDPNDKDLDNAPTVAMSPIRNTDLSDEESSDEESSDEESSDKESSDNESGDECKSALKLAPRPVSSQPCCTKHLPASTRITGVVLAPSRFSGRSSNEPIRSVDPNQLGSINNRITTAAGPSRFGPSNEHDDDDDEESSESDSDLEQERIIKQFQMTFGQYGSGRAAMFGQSGRAVMFGQSGRVAMFGQSGRAAMLGQSENAAIFG